MQCKLVYLQKKALVHTKRRRRGSPRSMMSSCELGYKRLKIKAEQCKLCRYQATQNVGATSESTAINTLHQKNWLAHNLPDSVSHKSKGNWLTHNLPNCVSHKSKGSRRLKLNCVAAQQTLSSQKGLQQVTAGACSTCIEFEVSGTQSRPAILQKFVPLSGVHISFRNT
jgi:hypothetical protein